MVAEVQSLAPNPVLWGYRLRLEPRRDLGRLLFGFADARRWVWNACVAWQKAADLVAQSAGARYASGSVFTLTYLCRLLDDWCIEEPWLKHVPKQALQQAIADFIRARRAFLTGAVKAPPGDSPEPPHSRTKPSRAPSRGPKGIPAL